MPVPDRKLAHPRHEADSRECQCSPRHRRRLSATAHHPHWVMRSDGAAAHPVMMNEKAGTATGRRPPAPRAAHDGERHEHEHRHDDQPAGVDLPLLGHVPYQSLGFWAGLGVAGAVGVIEWPVAAAVGIGYALARR
jgi:hypothetical protein